MDQNHHESSHSSMKASLIHMDDHPMTERRRYSLFNHTINELEAASSANHSYKFISMAVLTSTMMFAEIITGIVTGSLTLLSDAMHMMSDLIALIIGFTAHKKANGQSSKTDDSFEHILVYMRYEIIGALINGTVLLTSCFIMALEALQRILFFNEEIENVNYVLIVGGLGLLINVIGLVIFGHAGHDHGHGHNHSHSNHQHESERAHNIDIELEQIPTANPKPLQTRHNHHDHIPHHSVPTSDDIANEKNLNLHGVFLHILGDLLGSVAVMVSACVIKFTDGVSILS